MGTKKNTNEKIISDPGNVALFLIDAISISQLPLELKSALCVLACFGSSTTTNVALIQLLEETG